MHTVSELLQAAQKCLDERGYFSLCEPLERTRTNPAKAGDVLEVPVLSSNTFPTGSKVLIIGELTQLEAKNLSDIYAPGEYDSRYRYLKAVAE